MVLKYFKLTSLSLLAFVTLIIYNCLHFCGRMCLIMCKLQHEFMSWNEGMFCEVGADRDHWWPVLLFPLSHPQLRPERSSDRSGKTSRPRTSSCWTRCPSSTTAALTTSSPALRLSLGRRLVNPLEICTQWGPHAYTHPTVCYNALWELVKQWIKCLMEGSV